METKEESDNIELYDEKEYDLKASIPNTLVSSLLKAVKRVTKETKVSVPKMLVTALKASKMKHDPFISSKPSEGRRFPPKTNFLLNELLMRCNIAAMGSIYTADIAKGHIYAPSVAEIVTFMITNGKTSHYGGRLPKNIGYLNRRGFSYGLHKQGIVNKKNFIMNISRKKPLVKRNILKTIKYANKEEKQFLDALKEYVPIRYKKYGKDSDDGTSFRKAEKHNKCPGRLSKSLIESQLSDSDVEENHPLNQHNSQGHISNKNGSKKCGNIYPDIDIKLKAIVIPIRPPQTCWASLECVPKRMLKKTKDDEVEKIESELPTDYEPPVSKPTFVVALRGSRMWYDWAIDGIVDTAPFPPSRVSLSDMSTETPVGDDEEEEEEGKLMAHKGMANSALYLANTLIPILQEYAKGFHNRKLKDSVVTESPNGNVWDVIITGHSYGAGVATLVAPLLRPLFPNLNVTAIGYATPACMSISLSKAVRDYVTTVIFETDLVPRLGAYPISLMLRNYIDYKKGKRVNQDQCTCLEPDVIERDKAEIANDSYESKTKDEDEVEFDRSIPEDNIESEQRKLVSPSDPCALVPAGKILVFRFCVPEKGFVHAFPEYKKDKISSKDEKPRKFVYNPNKDYNLRLVDSSNDIHKTECIPHKFGTVNHDLSNYLRGFENIRLSTRNEKK